mmetsp:Transcript_56102/g.88938  ORF Transcript_56102/g.88938 Transcript_56102/m.88938 type:complete len:271 (+) Transcript_56102:1201-2013(+)
MNNQIWMINCTTKRCQQIKNMGIIVQNCSTLDVSVKLYARLLVQTRIEIHFLFGQGIFTNHGFNRRQLQVSFALFLGTSKHRLSENISTQSVEGRLSSTHVSIFDYRVGDFAFEMRVVQESNMPTIWTITVAHKTSTLAIATLLLAIIESKGSDAKKANEGIKLADAILQRRARETPLMASRLQRISSQCSTVRTTLNTMRLVQDDTRPNHSMKRRSRKIHLPTFISLILYFSITPFHYFVGALDAFAFCIVFRIAAGRSLACNSPRQAI